MRGNKRVFEIVKTITKKERGNPAKCFVLQEIKFLGGESTLRLGYYIIGNKPKSKGRWVWGQFAPLIPKADLLELVDKARKKGVLNT